MTPEITRYVLATDMPFEAWLIWLRAQADRHMPTARRAALLRIIWHEAHLTRNGLLSRVADLLGRGCFGVQRAETFTQDIEDVRQTLAAAGHELRDDKGYYVVGRPPLDEKLQRLIAASVAEVDPQQIGILRRLTIAQRVQQGFSLIALAEHVAAYRLQQRKPYLNQIEAQRIVRERMS